ncbi:hypothetical protein CS542_02115 [Pedobacter sp. IW39]|nr:hypothetical protein CS542_02115 [Pedobacter sp. IW39]
MQGNQLFHDGESKNRWTYLLEQLLHSWYLLLGGGLKKVIVLNISIDQTRNVNSKGNMPDSIFLKELNYE